DVRETKRVAAAVDLVGQHRATDARQVHANLVRAARARLDAAERVTAKTLDHFVETARLLAFVVLVIENGHLDAVAGMVADAFFDVIAIPVEDAGGEGEILLEDLAALELSAEVAVGGLFLRNEDDAAGVAVEAVDDAGAVIARDVAQMSEVKRQR